MEGSRLIILDRDGVINQDSDAYIKSPEEWQALPGSLEAIARLCKAEYRVVIISNQSGIKRGLFTLNTLNQIHQKMLDQLHSHGGEINAIFFCPHHPDDDCDCRKPKAGLYQSLSQRLQCNFEGVDSIGDSLRDLEAAQSAGANPVLVRTGNGQKTAQQLSGTLANTPIFDDLASYVDSLRSEGRLEA